MTGATRIRLPADRWILGVWGAALVVRLVCGALIPLFLDEAYYWTWSHELRLSYLDHPPFVAWLFLLGHGLESLGHAVRWPGVLMGHAALLIWVVLLQGVLDRRQLRWWLAMALLAPMISAGSLIITPDTPLSFFWPLALLLFLRLARQATIARALLLGAALGFGFTSKYTMVVFAPIGLVWLWKEGRLDLLRPKWVALVSAGFILGSWPVWVWNAANGWSSFAFQLGRGPGTGWDPMWTLDFLWSQLALIFPTIAFLALWKRGGVPAWLALSGWGPVVFFLLTSVTGPTEANWPGIGYPALLALALHGRERLRWAAATCGVWGVAQVLVLTHLAWWWLPLPNDRLRREVRAYEHLHEAAATYEPLFAGSYQMAAKLTYEVGRPVYQLRGRGRISQYWELPQSVPTTDRYFLVIAAGRDVPAVVKGPYEEGARISFGEHDVVEMTLPAGGAR